MLNRRVHILLDKEMWKKIVKYAKDQKISSGEYIRKAVDEYMGKQKEIVSKEQKTPFNRLFNRRQK